MTSIRRDDPDMPAPSPTQDGDGSGHTSGGTPPMTPTEGEIGAGAMPTRALDNPVEPSGTPQRDPVQAHLPGSGPEPAAGFGDEGLAGLSAGDDPPVYVAGGPNGAWRVTREMINAFRALYEFNHPPVVRHDLSGTGGGADKQNQEANGDEPH